MKTMMKLFALGAGFALSLVPVRAAILQVGTNWTGTPYPDVQSAVDAATDGDEIWVEQGTYVLTNTIVIDKSLAVYGGFDGTETQRGERDWTNQIAIVDGNGGVRCFHVAASNAAAVVLDGLTIARGSTSATAENGPAVWNGNTTGSVFGDLSVVHCTIVSNVSGKHGAIFNDWGNLSAADSTFRGNTAVNKGGAIINYGHDLTVVRCLFSGNGAGNAGAVSYPNTAGTPSASNHNAFVDCVFSNNVAGSDGGAVVGDGNAAYDRCVFVGNSASRYGTLALRGDTNFVLTLTNCLFANNVAKYGGAICINGSAGALGTVAAMNCTFASNALLASGKGGAVYTMKPSTNADSRFALVNCIVWGNATNAIDRSGTTQPLPLVSYSDIDQDGYAGSDGNLHADPLFADPAGGNYRLQAGSPCLNAAADLDAPENDLDNALRPQGDGYDMGAYELAAAAVEALSAEDVSATSAALAGDLTSTGGAPTTVYAYWGADLVDVLPITVDTYVDFGRPTNNYGTSGSAKVVASTTPARTLFMLPEDLWTNDVSQIVSATVSFYVWNDSTGDQEFRLYPLTQAFAEGTGAAPADGATWNTRDGSNAWTTAGGDYDAGASVPGAKGMAGVYSNDANGKFFTWNITSLLTNPATRAELQAYGALLDAGTATPQKFASFNSSDKTGYPQAYLPALTLVRANGTPDQSANLGVLPEGAFSNVVENLQPNTSYTFTFMASNAVGSSWAPTPGTFTTLANAPAIENADAGNVTAQSATLNAVLTSDGGLSTKLYYAFGTDPTSWTMTALAGAYPEGNVSVNVSSLTPDTTYYYQFMASNAAGIAWAATTNHFTTWAAPGINAISAEDVSATSAALVGDLTSDGGAPTTVYAYWGENLVQTLPIDTDTYVDYGRPTNNYGASGSAKVVASATPCRTLFTLPADLWTNDAAQIVSATVSFYTWNDTSATQDFRLYPLTQAFAEGTGAAPADGATWNTRDGSNAWTTAGGDYDAGASVPGVKGMAGVYSNDANGKFFTWDITPLLTNATTRAELQSCGALIDAGTASPQRYATFNSSDKTGYPQAYLPFVTLVLANPAPAQSADLGILPEGAFTNAVGDLQPNASYTFTFMASNAAGAVWAPTPGTFTTLADAPAVENAAAGDVTDLSATLNATLTSDGGLPTKLYYAFGTDPASWSVAALAGACPEGDIGANVGGLAPGTTYYYRFMASNAVGAVWASVTNSFATTYSATFGEVTFSNGTMTVNLDGLSANATNVVERSFDLESNEWTVVTNVVGSGATNWVDESSSEWTNVPVFYRLRLLK